MECARSAQILTCRFILGRPVHRKDPVAPPPEALEASRPPVTAKSRSVGYRASPSSIFALASGTLMCSRKLVSKPLLVEPTSQSGSSMPHLWHTRSLSSSSLSLSHTSLRRKPGSHAFAQFARGNFESFSLGYSRYTSLCGDGGRDRGQSERPHFYFWRSVLCGRHEFFHNSSPTLAQLTWILWHSS